MIGVLGGGQLGRMMALAGTPLGHTFRFLDPDEEAPARHLGEQVIAKFDDLDSLDSFARGCDVVTYEFENVPVQSVEHLDKSVATYPPAQALRVAQDRLLEKNLFRDLGIGTPKYAAVDSLDDLRNAVIDVGFPCVLKTRRMGYDGKGQTVLRSESSQEDAWQKLDRSGLIAESFVPFQRELSIISVRSLTGEIRFYPLIENHHREGILRISRAPAPDLPPALTRRAEELARAVLERLQYVGVLVIELFQRGQELIANEMAPRVHNSGHWTMEGAEVSQFENHLRAILGLPLGSTTIVQPSVMVNLIGNIPRASDVLAVPGSHLHLYGKSPREGRKVGHITLRSGEGIDLEESVKAVRALTAE